MFTFRSASILLSSLARFSCDNFDFWECKYRQVNKKIDNRTAWMWRDDQHLCPALFFLWKEFIARRNLNLNNYVRKQLERGTSISIQINTKASSWPPAILSLVDTPIRLSLRLNQATPDAYQWKLSIFRLILSCQDINNVCFCLVQY